MNDKIKKYRSSQKRGGHNMLELITKGKRLITLEEIASFFSVHEDTVIKWIKEGLITAIKVNRTYRLTEEEFQAFIDRHTTQKSS
jgi:excisionase family DNA binding protein